MTHLRPSAKGAVGVLLVFMTWTASISHGEVQHAEPSFQTLVEQAAGARDAGNTTNAIRLYSRIVRMNPRWQEGWWYLGSLYYDRSDYRHAISSLRNLTTLNSQLGGAWALLGLSEFETRDFSDSLGHLQRARKLGMPDQQVADVADYHLALLLNLQGRFEESTQLLSRLLLSGKNSEDLQVALGLNLLRVALLPSQVDPSKDALIHGAGEVAGCIAKRQYDQADLGFQNLLKQYPQAHFVHYAHGAMLAVRGQDDAAESEFREETRLTPESALAYSEWGFIELRAKRYDTALPLAQTAVRLSPGFFMSHYLLGSILFARGDVRTSISELEAARRLAPEVPEVRYSLSRAYAKSGKNELARREHAEFLRLRSRLDSRVLGEQSDAGSATGDTAERPVEQIDH